MIKAVSFDLDGTLINKLYSLEDKMNKTLNFYNLDGITLDETKQFIGYGYKTFVEKALNKNIMNRNDKSLINLLNDLENKYLEIFKYNSTYNLVPYDGIFETINKLKKDNIYIICITNKPEGEAVKVLNSVFDENTFDIISGDDNNHPLKPNPMLLDSILNKLSITKDEIIHIGDSKTDIEFANNAKIKSIGCTYGFREKAELIKYNPTSLVDNAYELYDTIKKLNI